ncbi:TetR family transcriptional regulator [Paenibacillus lycopersici]|uniref:TetR family transcriptional regulator n=1 Tax=Paenibacillus lycopersici TaxID=2704462 RepID=A0A6C0FNU7_9BACL|nr:TetR family transcriptional regulator [Paenibacillus lycopersici]QHT58816.1 TetR family transcriptional regulator [Paenibacillus lycopersici]
MSAERPEPAKMGLREKKKLRTRLTLQQQGLRLFREQGYAATTIEQIAEASDISPSTFFRYFPTKEALVLEDDDDRIMIDSFLRQPAELSPIRALRLAIQEGFGSMSPEAKESLSGRMGLMMTVPELRAASLIQMNEMLIMIAKLSANRLGRSGEDFDVMLFAGSIVGAMMAVQLYCADHPEADFFAVVDEALALYEAGLPLGVLGQARE